MGPALPGPQPSRSRYRQLGWDILGTFGAYLKGQVIVSTILSCLYAVGFGILHVPAWPVIAPVCGFLNMVPIFGTPVALVLGLGLTFADTGDLERVLWVMGVFVVVLTLEGYVLTPRIIGRRLGLRPLYVFLAVLLGGALFGFFGILLAAPLLAIINVLIRFGRSGRRPPPETTTNSGPLPSSRG